LLLDDRAGAEVRRRADLLAGRSTSVPEVTTPLTFGSASHGDQRAGKQFYKESTSVVRIIGGVAVVGAVALGGGAIAGGRAVVAAGTYLVTEGAEAVVEEVTGVPIITDPGDVVQAGAKYVGKKTAKKAGKKAAAKAATATAPAAAPKAVVKGSGRAKNKLEADPSAQGPHSTYNQQHGQVTNHAEWDADGNPVKRTDVTGAPHGPVATPHTHVYGPPNVDPATGKTYPGNQVTVRPATPDELPK
jgi:hypothetical protein